MRDVNVDIANFNLTFGKEKLPLLTHFEDFIFPAFKSGLVREVDGTKYMFESVKLIETNEGLAIKGFLVKDTMLEVKSQYEDGRLIETDKLYPSAPYSLFCMLLKNHRMILVPNQKGSPDLRSFNVTARTILKMYRKEENKIREKTNKELIPYFDLRVTGLPSKKELLEELKGVKKIDSLKIRFYPLNGEDINSFDVINEDIVRIRELVGSNTGNLTLNSPENKRKTAELVEELGDTVDATLNVEYADKSKGKIKNNSFAEKRVLSIDSNQVRDDDQKIIEDMVEVPKLVKTSDTNQKTYNRFIGKLKKLLNG
ncbi:hypothetical protein [Enterococcus faecalis]|nr:hypothetical protein [Enterococcus faecalis]EGO6570122.1 hypothetical protein [Enterococcus faecalis]EGO7756671.1 hypothetical protein [Enterococcus faecalis]EGO8279969.1 hypothetical protein [Enterococcus faecalis]EGO8520002.1 hypothetical protein [Enterococcus faecalis]EHK9405034.1 hypothetical protein [Enterococcus faecalis]